MIFKTIEQITSKFIQDGWSKNISFKELEIKEAEEKGLLFAIEGIKKGRKYFIKNDSNNIYDDRGKVVWYNIRMCK
jgi:hypothetical protein